MPPKLAWVGDEPGLTNVRRILARRGGVELTLHFLEPLTGPDLADRKAMAAAARTAITARLKRSACKRVCKVRPIRLLAAAMRERDNPQDLQGQELRLPDERL